MNLTVTASSVVAAAAAVLSSVAASAAPLTTLTIDTVAPSTDILVSQTLENQFTRTFDSDGTNATQNGTTGQTFTLEEIPGAFSRYAISSITVKHSNNGSGNQSQDFSPSGLNLPGATLDFSLFEYSPSGDANDISQWSMGDGNSDNDQFDGTGVTNVLVAEESFSAFRSWDDEFLHFEFSTPLLLDEDTAYGFTIGFDDGNGVTAPNGDQNSLALAIARDFDGSQSFLPSILDPGVFGEAYLGGVGIRSRSAENDAVLTGAPDDLVFYVQGIAVPEPSSALLALGAVGVIGLRRRLA